MITLNYLNEEWRDIKGYEGYYQISNYGRVKSLERTVNHGMFNTSRNIKEKLLKQHLNTHGYYNVGLSKNCIVKQVPVHRLVAEAFLPNPYNLPYVDHIDGNRKNNFVFVNDDGSVDFKKSNLRWVTPKENARNPNTINNMNSFKKGNIPWNKGKQNVKITGEKHFAAKKVMQYSLNNIFIQEWVTASEVQKVIGYSQSAISQCCRGKLKTAYGYIWKFKEDV